jgi:hypothetical protein
MKTINIHYIFKFPNKKKEEIDLRLDSQTLEIINDITQPLPLWTKLNVHQCPHCPLDVQISPHCPVASNLTRLLSLFESLLSFDTIQVNIFTHQRIMYKETSAQKGTSSLMGLIMAVSGCPHMVFLKPMARFHLPLADAEETVYRAVSMYLLSQYFLQKQGKQIDMDLKGLKKIYANIKKVNDTMAKRLQTISDKDVSTNALVILDTYAQTIPFAIDNTLKEISPFFEPYFL